ncbi:MAG: glycoside hydrolase family 20 zincin-like fold domain-containing protein, partial [Duncaniella sp.]|nr:glycoside hydrolase family 20 zincin-like fold domain-containing protein [Duncaniella sp.]
MVRTFLLIVALIALGFTQAFADRFVNLTPAPAEMTVGEGSFKIPHGMTVAVSGLTPDMQAEVTGFIKDFNHATGLGIKQAKKGQMHISLNSSIAPEGYNLSITQRDIKLEAATPAGLF